jgi:DNA invertase Pin-like site-specific DNA recombinase
MFLYINLLQAKQGSYAGGRPALGYLSDKQNKSLVVNHDKVKTIKRTFELKLQGLSLQEIADQLNLEGFTTAQNKIFVKMQVKRILDRKEFYSGVYNYANIKSMGKHKAIF